MSDLEKFPVIPVIVLDDANEAEPLAAAAESIERIAKAFPDMMVGAGTVVTEEQAKRAIDAGSRFGLAPGTDPETIAFFKE
jgi:2-dehydro-3-deoxyphosphogluconate aldolase/(4S)-4-hydroxy-2-oxoglutarate aldolase